MLRRTGTPTRSSRRCATRSTSTVVPHAYIGIDDFVTVLAATPGWTLEVNDMRLGRAGSTSAAHHVDDRVLRAGRSG